MACDAHAHIFGPQARFPFAAGRGYTPPDLPVARYLALLDQLGFARGLVVQGNAHGFDNAVVLDALEVGSGRLRGIGIASPATPAMTLHAWHAAGMRGLRFHLFAPGNAPGYVRGVGLEALAHFAPVMRDLGWVVQLWCDPAVFQDALPQVQLLTEGCKLVLDHLLNVPPEAGPAHPAFQALLRLVGQGQAVVKLSAGYRLSRAFPDYPDMRPFHDALLEANPNALLWGTDWPHVQTEPEVMPDDGALLDVFHAWTQEAAHRQAILVATPARLFWDGQA
jgi:predicted TIM-barrel fold metal-dependent hydrolase